MIRIERESQYENKMKTMLIKDFCFIERRSSLFEIKKEAKMVNCLFFFLLNSLSANIRRSDSVGYS